MYLLPVFLALIAAVYSFPKPPSHYIVGGENAKPNEFPWQLSLQSYSSNVWRHICGASILSTKYALTAAHCVNGSKANLRVVAGLHLLSDLSKATIVAVKSYKVHEKYDNNDATIAHDIAILAFDKELKLSPTVQAAVLPKDNKNQFVNMTCTITGWGSNNTVNPDTLQKGTVITLSNEECKKRVSNGTVIGPGHLCVYDRSEKTSACRGDSGGPASCKVDGKETVVGLTSFGYVGPLLRCKPYLPSVYTRTSEYLDWIKKNTP